MSGEGQGGRTWRASSTTLESPAARGHTTSPASPSTAAPKVDTGLTTHPLATPRSSSSVNLRVTQQQTLHSTVRSRESLSSLRLIGVRDCCGKLVSRVRLFILSCVFNLIILRQPPYLRLFTRIVGSCSGISDLFPRIDWLQWGASTLEANGRWGLGWAPRHSTRSTAAAAPTPGPRSRHVRSLGPLSLLISTRRCSRGTAWICTRSSLTQRCRRGGSTARTTAPTCCRAAAASSTSKPMPPTFAWSRCCSQVTLMQRQGSQCRR